MKRYLLVMAVLLVALGKVEAQSSPNVCVKSTEGKDFWFGFMENRLSVNPNYAANYLEITVTSRYSCQFSITLGKNSVPEMSGTLVPNTPQKIRIDRLKAEPYGSETIEEKAIHLVSDQPLNIYTMNYGYNSADAAVIFPVEALGNEYFAMCYEPNVSELPGGIPWNGKNSEFVVVATDDQTKVTITPTKVTDQLKPANVPFTITLNKGELCQIQSMNHVGLTGQGDLTGTYIKSDKPIALYSGSWATTVPITSSYAWDHLYEQMPPLRSWGRKFVTVPLKTRSRDTYRILASVDQTSVRISNKSTVVLDKGKFYEFMLNQDEPSLIVSDQPVLLAQYSNSNDVDGPPTTPPHDGDPSMLIVSPVDQTREDVTFVAYDTPEIWNKLYVNIVTSDNSVNQIQLDGGPISFVVLPGSGYSYAQVPISVGNHNLKSTEVGKGFIAYVYGFGGVESYGYSVGFNLSTRLDLGGDIHFVKDTIVLCNGETKTLDAGAQFTTYSWKPGGETTQKINVNKPGYYEVTASTQDGCVLTAGIHAIASIASVNLGKDTTICKNQSFLADAGAGFSSYLWSDNETTRTISVKTAGIYSVIATNKYGCLAKDTIRIGYGNLPKLDLSRLDTLVCGSKSTTVNISADKGTYKFTSSNQSVTISNLSATVPGYGKYSFNFTATDQYSCATDTNFTMGFHKKPSVDFSIQDTLCYNYTTAAQYLGDATVASSKFLWIYSNDTLATGIGKDKVQIVIGKEQKKRNLYLKVEEDGCSDSHEIAEIKVIPDVSFTVSDTLICDKTSVRFSAANTENAVDYLWDWGDGIKEHLSKDAIHNYQKGGNFDVQLSVSTDKKCTGIRKKSKALSVSEAPVVAFSIRDNQCLEVGEQTLYDTGSSDEFAKYNWNLSAFLPDEIIRDPGNTKGPLIFNLKSRPNVSIDLQVISKLGCSSDKKLLQIQRKPDFSVTASKNAGCVPLTVDLKSVTIDQVDQVSYFWDFGSGTTVSGSQVSYTYTAPKESYDITILAESGTTGCKDTLVKSQWIRAYPLPKALFTVQNSMQCMTDDFLFSAFDNGTGAQYKWNLGDGTNATGKDLRHKYTAVGHFDVSLNVTSSHGCMDQSLAGQSVYAAPVPTIGFSIDPSICLEPGNTNLNYVGNATDKDQFIWDLTQLDSGEITQNPGTTSGPLIFNLLNKSIAAVSLQVVSQYGCKTENKQLTIKRKPLFSLEADTRIGCPPLKVALAARTGDGTDRIDYHWDFGDGITSTGQDVSHTYMIADKYFDLSLQAISKITGCSGSIAEKGYIRVYPKPVAGFSWTPPEVFNDQPDVSFNDKSIDAESYHWDFGDGSQSDLKEPSHKYEDVGTMKVIQSVYNQYQCADTLISNLVVGLRKLYIPNAFSPMADNIVDRVFIPYAKGVNKEGYRLRILSRWNDVIFDSKNQLLGWDGKLNNGTMAQAGNYLWILEFVDFEGKAHRQNGTVMLIY